MCKKSFKKFDHRDYKIITLEVKKRVFCKIGSTNFEFSWLKAFALCKVEVFDIVLGN